MIWLSESRPGFRKVLDCGSPLPLSHVADFQKRQKAAALHDAGARYARQRRLTSLPAGFMAPMRVQRLRPKLAKDAACFPSALIRVIRG